LACHGTAKFGLKIPRLQGPRRLDDRAALVKGRGYVSDGESLELWARFDADGHLWLDLVTVGTTEPKASYPISGEGSVVARSLGSPAAAARMTRGGARRPRSAGRPA